MGLPIVQRLGTTAIQIVVGLMLIDSILSVMPMQWQGQLFFGWTACGSEKMCIFAHCFLLDLNVEFNSNVL
jgi:hypothetical protein